MVRLSHQTAAKLQAVVLAVKGVDRFHWSDEKRRIGGFIADNEEYRKKEQMTKKAKPDPRPPVIPGKEYPQLLGQKVVTPAPSHDGTVRYYNFKDEAAQQLHQNCYSIFNKSQNKGCVGLTPPTRPKTR